MSFLPFGIGTPNDGGLVVTAEGFGSVIVSAISHDFFETPTGDEVIASALPESGAFQVARFAAADGLLSPPLRILILRAGHGKPKP